MLYRDGISGEPRRRRGRTGITGFNGVVVSLFDQATTRRQVQN